MALGCNLAQKINNVREVFIGYLPNKPCWCKHFGICPGLLYYTFSFPYKLLQFILQLF